MIREFFLLLWTFLSDLFFSLITFLGELFSNLFEGLISFFADLFSPVIQLVAAIFYFLYKLGIFIMLVIQLLYKLVYFFVFIMKGLFVTLIGMNYIAVPANLPPRYGEVINQVSPIFDILQLNKIPVVLLWAVWVFIGVTIVKIIGAKGDG